MFKLLKEKLKAWLDRSKKEAEEKAEKEAVKLEREAEKLEKEEKTTKKKAESLKKEIKKEKKELEEAEKRGEEEKIEDIKEEISSEKQELKEAEEKIEEEEKKIGLVSKLKKFFAYQLTESDFEKIFSDLELVLLENNVAFEVIEKIKSELKPMLLNKEMKKQNLADEIKNSLRKTLEGMILNSEDIIKKIKEQKESRGPYKIIFFGINGAGKTTSIAKFAHLCLKNKLSCVFAASDTFRAASIEQLQTHADNLGIKMIKHAYGSDPSAVAFDAIKYAQQNNIDVVLIDTAGRMHTKTDLLREMEKISRVTKPNLKVFVAEAIAGSDVVAQCQTFNEAVGIDGIILAKSDVDEKGGAIVSVSYVTKKPVLYLGVGQNYDDLELFDKKKFIERLGL